MTKVLALSGLCLGFPDGAVVKSPPANARGTGLILESERSPGVGNGNPLQYSCLENSMDRAVWRATVHGVAESDMTEQPEHAQFLFMVFSILWK